MNIYKITNKINNKSYIGLTTKSIEKRFKDHQYIAESGNGYYIHAAIRKYGIDNFNLELIDTADNIEELKELEISNIEKYDTFNSGYNLTAGGDFTSNQGRVVVRDKLKNVMQINVDDFCKLKYEHINKNSISIFNEQNHHIRVSPAEYKNKYFDKGYRSKNFGYTTIINEDGIQTKIKAEEFNKNIHSGINKGRRTFFNKKTKQYESLESNFINIDLETYCSTSRFQYEIHTRGNIFLYNNMDHIPKELGFSQFRYMAHRNKGYTELVITREVLDGLKPKSRDYSLIGTKLVKVKY